MPIPNILKFPNIIQGRFSTMFSYFVEYMTLGQEDYLKEHASTIYRPKRACVEICRVRTKR